MRHRQCQTSARCYSRAPSMRMLVVVPAYNEEKALPALIEEMRAAFTALPIEAEMIVVDDGSSDRTGAIASSLGVRVLRLRHNLGIGGAVQTGLRVALR